MMRNINPERLIKAKEANKVILKIETKESARLKLMMQVEKLDIDLHQLYEEMHKIHQEIYSISNPQNNNEGGDDEYCENAADVVE